MIWDLKRRVKDSKFGAWNTGVAFYRNWEDYLRNKTVSGCPGSNHCLCIYCIRGSLSWSNKGPLKHNGSQKMCLFPFHVISLRSVEDAGGSYISHGYSDSQVSSILLVQNHLGVITA